MYEYQSLECLVAIERGEAKKIKAFRKKYKGKNDKPGDTVSGYKFVVDEEFDSLKIDFSEQFDLEIRHLVNVKG